MGYKVIAVSLGVHPPAHRFPAPAILTFSTSEGSVPELVSVCEGVTVVALEMCRVCTHAERVTGVRPLLMIPGPIEVSPEVQQAHDGPPPGHLAPPVVEAFSDTLDAMRLVWDAPPSSQPFVVAGSGTLAMDAAAANLVDPGDRVLVVNTGYFSERMAEILLRYGGEVSMVDAPVGKAVPLAEVEAAVQTRKPKAVFVTHVDTSTGVRMDPAAVSAIANQVSALTVVDGVCATAAEPLSMTESPVDLYLTGSQKAVGLPAGLAMFVVSERALSVRKAKRQLPPLYLDFESWLPIMKAYGSKEKAYFATPATNLIRCASVGMKQLVEDKFEGKSGIRARWARHAHVACAMEGAWRAFGLSHLCSVPQDRGITLSALKYPEGVDPSLVAKVGQRGVVIAGGLHPSCKGIYFRVGHMGYATTQRAMLERTVRAVGEGLSACGQPIDVEAGVSAFTKTFDSAA